MQIGVRPDDQTKLYEEIEKLTGWEREQTNKEWIQSATTEQLADVFFEYRYVNATPKQKLWMSANEECIKTEIVEWLKEKHNDLQTK